MSPRTIPADPLAVETDLKRAILARLAAVPGIRAWRQHAGMLRVRGGMLHLAPRGAGDLCGTAAPGGLHWELETKGVATAAQPDQEPWGEATRAAGAVYLRVRRGRSETVAACAQRAVVELLEAIAAARGRRGGGE